MDNNCGIYNTGASGAGILPRTGGEGSCGYGASIKSAVAALLLLCAAASAYSPLGLQYPLGTPDLAVTGAAAGIGGSGTAVIEEYFGTVLNPANAAIGKRSVFSALVSLDMVNIDDNGKNSSVSGYAPKLLSLIIPIGVAGNLGFSMQRRYDANLNFYTADTLELDNDKYNFKTASIELTRRGGLTAWQAGWAYRFVNGLSLGLLYERLYYNLESRDVFESTFRYNLESGPTTYRSNVVETITRNFASDGIRFGMQVPVHEKVTLGAAAEYILPGSENGRTAREYIRSDSEEPLKWSEGKYSVNLPSSFNMGAAYRPDERWLFAADAHTTFWEMYENDLDADAKEVQHVYGVSGGVRFIPAVNKLTADYWQTINYSAGLRYSTMPYVKNLNNETEEGAYEIGFTLGAGLPIPSDGGMVDIIVDIGRRTDSRYNGYSENTVKIQLGINGGRNWFQRE